MKKNKIMRLASVLLIAVLLSTSIISGTFAKYVTMGETSDSARVAKFGVVITASGKLFDKTYYSQPSGSSNMPGVENDNDNNTLLTVESSTNDKVVAPGTKSDNDGLKLNITGAPEVDVYIKYDITKVSDIYLKQFANYPDMTTSKVDEFDNTSDYYPIVFTLSGWMIGANASVIEAAETGATVTGNSVSGTIDQVIAALQAINNVENGKGVRVEANTDLATSGYGELNLTWEWNFDYDGAGTYDQQDTLLGDIIAQKLALQTSGEYYGAVTFDGVQLTEGTHYSTDVNVKISVSVTQID